MVGRTIWYVSCGGAVGRSFSLAIGEKVLRESPIEGGVQDDFSSYRGEFALYVWCTWRLDAGDVAASSDQESEAFQPVLARLVNAKIRRAIARTRFADLTLETDDCVLQVFCDHIPPDSSFDGNWELVHPEGALYVGPGWEVRAGLE